jgi:hypothetical protein
LKFRLQKQGEEDYFVRSHSSHFMGRSVNAEINLDPGYYHVLMKITAFRHEDVQSTEEIVRQVASTRREKLVQVGLSYDLAHAKGLVRETEQEKGAKAQLKAQARRRLRDQTKKQMQQEWIRSQKLQARRDRNAARHESRMHNGGPYEHISERAPLPGQIIVGKPVEDSPVDMASISSEISDRQVPNTTGSVPTIHVNGGKELHARQSTTGWKRRADSPRPSLESRLATDVLDASDLELLEGFEFDSDVDLPPDDLDLKIQPPFLDQDEPSVDPWNAVCVVGLRVYSMDQNLNLQVVRPVLDDGAEAALDRDDPAASATTTHQKDSGHSWSGSWSSQLSI